MRTILHAALFLATVIASPAGAADPPAAPQPGKTKHQERQPRPLEIELKTTEPVRFVFREQDGPYWQVGRLVAEVAAHLSEAKLSHPIVVRYGEDPARAPQERLATRVGYFAEPDEPVEPPFREEPIDAETVAFAVGPARSAKPLQVAAGIRAWCAEQGHETVGPVNEIHLPAIRGGGKGARVEIQLPIRPTTTPPTAPAHDQPAQPPTVDEPAPAEPAPPVSEEPATPDLVVEPPHDDAESATPAEPDSATPPGSQPATEPGRRVEVTIPVPAARHQPRPQPEPTEPAESAKPANPLEPPAAPRRAVVRDHASAGRWTDLAAALLPSEAPPTGDTRDFCGAVIIRLEAVGDALAAQHGEPGRELAKLAEALATQYAATGAGARRALPAIYRIKSSDPLASAKKDVIAQLDTLARAVGGGALGPEQARTRATDALVASAAILDDAAKP